MRITNSFFLCLIFIFLSITHSFALGQAASMGNLQSIVPSGPFDAGRNPALLPLQISKNSTGLFYSYIMHFAGEDSANYNQHRNNPGPPVFEGGINSSLKQKDPKIYGMAGRVANVTRPGNFAFGFAVTDNGNDQYLVTEIESIREHIGTDLSNNTTIFNKTDETTKTTEINPAFVSSLGFNISKIGFIGLQLILGYSNKAEKIDSFVQNYFGTLPMPADIPTYREKRNKEATRFSTELGFGYLYKDSGAQFGLLLRTGEISWTKKELNVRRDNIFPSVNTLNAGSSVKMNGKYSTGPGIVAGAYKKINPVLGIAFESGIKFENSFSDTDLDYNEKINKVEEQKNSTTVNNIYTIRAGLDISPANNLAFAFGLSYMTGSAESGHRKIKGTYENYFIAEMDVDYGTSTAGIQYFLNKNITIDLITYFTVYKKTLNIRMREEDKSTSYETELSAEEKNAGFFLHTGIGVTLSF